MHPAIQGLPVDADMLLRKLHQRFDPVLGRPPQCVNIDVGRAQGTLPEGLEAVVEMGVKLVPDLVFLNVAVIVLGVEELLNTFLGAGRQT